MAYEPITWQDAPSTATPLSAENLNHMEEGISSAHGALASTVIGVLHGADASVPRPAATIVVWVGTVQPTNMTEADIYNGPAA